MKGLFVTGTCLCLSSIPLIAQQTFPGKIGVGVSLSQWSKSFVNIVKQSRAFEQIGGDELAPMDSLGWPLTDAKLVLLEVWPVAEWWSDIDDPEEYHTDVSGTYHGSFEGRADLSRVWGDFTIANQRYDEVTNTTTFEIIVGKPASGVANGLVILQFTNTRRSPQAPLHSGFTNLRVVRPGYDLNTSQIFNDDFLNALNSAGFSTIRSMGFTQTNTDGCGNADGNNPWYPHVLEWKDRRPVDAATYRYNPDISLEHGAPWEMVIELANVIGKDIWINVPVAATDDYVRQLATLFRDNLNPDLKVYVEYSNEVWNWSFKQACWNNENAQAQGLTYIEGYARRTAEIALIFRQVFGPQSLNHRVRVVNCWQIGWWPPDVQYDEQMQFIDRNFGPPGTLIYALGVAPYFNCVAACETGTVSEILAAMRASSDASVASRRLVFGVAEKWNLPGRLVAYEGGPDTGGGSTINVENRIRAERDAGMKELMIHDLRDNWFPLGGELFMYLELAGNYNRYGSWGLTDEVANPDRNYKFAAVRELLGEVTSTPPANNRLPLDFALEQNHPNPFHTNTMIAFRIRSAGYVSLAVYNLLGAQVAQLVDQWLAPGDYHVDWNPGDLPAGVYLYRLKTRSSTKTMRMILLR